MKTRLILVRHAEAEGNYIRRFHGWTDGDITEKGHMQARLVAERLRDVPVDVLYSSSLKRTMQTAAYISEIKGLPVIRTDKLKEINGGDWEDMPFEILHDKWPAEYETWERTPHAHRMPNGESMEDFEDRLFKEVMYIINENIGKSVCMVTHGTAIRALLCHFRGCSLEEMINVNWCDNTALTVIDHEDSKFSIVTEGDTAHLDKAMKTIENQEWWIELNKQNNGG
jgi:probable phosphoglycerate mutase